MNKRLGIINLSIRLLKLAKSVKKPLIISTLASVLGNLSQMGFMGFGACIILNMAGIVNYGSTALWASGAFICAAAIVICRYLEGYISHAAAYQLLANMRVDMFDTIRKLAPACLMDRVKGDILSVAISDIETIEFFFAHTIGPIFTVILLPLTALIVAGCNHYLFVAALLPVYIVISVILPVVAMKTGRNIGMKYRTQVGMLKGNVLESIYGIKDIQIFGVGENTVEKIKQKTVEINNTAHIMTLHRQLVTAAPTFFVYLSRILVIAVASYLSISGIRNPAATIVLSFVVSASFSSTQSFIRVISSLLETYAAAERLFHLEDTLPEVVEAENPVDIGEIEEIKLENVEFKYNKTDKNNILSGINLMINKNDKIGIMGESGIGKSTVIRLLLRFWEPTGGKITVNGIPLKDISLKSLRKQIALIEQHTFIFNDSIRANIALGKPEATEEEIHTAAKGAGIHDFVLTLPDGYDTQMGEHGGRISGGEKQRIGIARAILSGASMLVMDEPTSNLDVLNEKGFLKVLKNQYADKTYLLVSHRKSTLTDCTQVNRLEGGLIHFS